MDDENERVERMVSTVKMMLDSGIITVDQAVVMVKKAINRGPLDDLVDLIESVTPS